MQGSGVWKVIKKSDLEFCRDGYIKKQKMDSDTNFILACRYHQIIPIVKQYYFNDEVVAVKIDIEKARIDGFKITTVYERSVSGSTDYWWRFDHDDLSKLLPCVFAKTSDLRTSTRTITGKNQLEY
jgi:hypothetical protein